MYRILVYCCLAYAAKSSPQSFYSYYRPNGVTSASPSPKNDVEIFASLHPNRFVPDPKPLPSPPVNTPSSPGNPLSPPVNPPLRPINPLSPPVNTPSSPINPLSPVNPINPLSPPVNPPLRPINPLSPPFKPPSRPFNSPPKPLYPPPTTSVKPNRTTEYPKKPTSSPKKPSPGTKIPPTFPIPPATAKKPNFPPTIHPFFVRNNTVSRPTYKPSIAPRNYFTTRSPPTTLKKSTLKRRSTTIPLSTFPAIVPQTTLPILTTSTPQSTSNGLTQKTRRIQFFNNAPTSGSPASSTISNNLTSTFPSPPSISSNAPKSTFSTFPTISSTAARSTFPSFPTKTRRITTISTTNTTSQSTSPTPHTTPKLSPTTIASSVPQTNVTPAWIYPPRPSWPRKPSHLEAPVEEDADIVAAGDTIIETRTSLSGLISEYQGYNEEDGTFQLGFQLQNGLSAKVRGYKKNGKHMLEGSYSLFTEDGKPVNIVYKADDDGNNLDAEPTIFHLDIPINWNFDEENYATINDNNAVPTLLPHGSRILKFETEDGQFSDLILQPTTETEQSDNEIWSTTEQQIYS